MNPFTILAFIMMVLCSNHVIAQTPITDDSCSEPVQDQSTVVFRVRFLKPTLHGLSFAVQSESSHPIQSSAKAPPRADQRTKRVASKRVASRLKSDKQMSTPSASVIHQAPAIPTVTVTKTAVSAGEISSIVASYEAVPRSVPLMYRPVFSFVDTVFYILLTFSLLMVWHSIRIKQVQTALIYRYRIPSISREVAPYQTPKMHRQMEPHPTFVAAPQYIETGG